MSASALLKNARVACSHRERIASRVQNCLAQAFGGPMHDFHCLHGEKTECRLAVICWIASALKLVERCAPGSHEALCSQLRHWMCLNRQQCSRHAVCCKCHCAGVNGQLLQSSRDYYLPGAKFLDACRQIAGHCSSGVPPRERP